MFKLIQDELLARGATYFERQQYVGFKNGTRAFLRADGYERVGVRLYFPDSMQIDPADVAYFGLDEGARGKNFSRTLRVQRETEEVALKYVVRALEMPEK